MIKVWLLPSPVCKTEKGRRDGGIVTWWPTPLSDQQWKGILRLKIHDPIDASKIICEKATVFSSLLYLHIDTIPE